MFPRFREQIGTALDLFVEFSTLGEYRLAAEGPGASSTPAEAPGQAPQLGGVGAQALRAAVRRTVAGGATGVTPVATPAARRCMRRHPSEARASRPSATRANAQAARSIAPSRRTRARNGAPMAAEQLCLAV